jgi:hypothetical protein
MYHITERNERRRHRIAMMFAIALHLAFVAMLYFKADSERPASPPAKAHPAKVNAGKSASGPSARTVHLAQ